uniref:Capsid protein n=1 Tax=Genomoviridae sp. TaxID=2202565 RepID=A0A8F5RCZ9_9VIRU|nr:MAG: capsid protein [Genomoviridae sp.]QXN75668.1 MAG: capsid protein [Genomoviridae sp.]
MPYGRYSRRRRYVRRTTPRRYRRSTTTFRKTRTRYRRKAPVRSRKRILNITSRKKVDSMITYGNFVGGVPSTTFSVGKQLLRGGPNQVYNLLWSPSWRQLNHAGGGVLGTVAEKAQRTATTCFMRGLKERVAIETVGGTSWRWRRIVFTAKGWLNQVPQSAAFAYALETTANGYVRVVNTMDAAAYAFVSTLLFRGTGPNDWNSSINAAVDTSRVTLLYDKTRVINPSTEVGCVRDYKMWHGFNKNLVYNDDENVETMTGNPFSVPSKPGMGDIMVMDIFDAGLASNTDDGLQLEFQSSLYWHER